MADFCKQCSIELWGEDTKDFQYTAPDGMVTGVLCEGCGPTWVQNDGTCVAVDCLHKHGEEEQTMTTACNVISFKYKNHKGEVRQRIIEPHRVEYWHKPGFGYE